MGKQRRWFSPEFKRDAIALVDSSERSIPAIAQELGIGETSLRGWVATIACMRATANPERFAAEVTESDEVKRLRRRVAELEVELEVLKRSMVFWVRSRMGEGFAFVSRQKAQFAVKILCRVCRVLTSGYHDAAPQAAGPTPAQRAETELIDQIRLVHKSRRPAS